MLDTTIGLLHSFLLTLGVELLCVILDTTVSNDHCTKAKGFLTPYHLSVDPCSRSFSRLRPRSLRKLQAFLQKVWK